MYLSLYCKFWKGLLRVYCERELETERNCNILTPTLMAISVVSFSFSWCSTRGPGAQLSVEYWLSLPQLFSVFSDPQLSDFLSWPSYIIVQRPLNRPLNVWSSSSGNNCHAVQRSLSFGASVYEYIIGFYLVPFHQLNPPTRSLSITGHWNVSLPSGASLWNGMFGRIEGQNTTPGWSSSIITRYCSCGWWFEVPSVL